MRKRGLKLHCRKGAATTGAVASLAEAWIEIVSIGESFRTIFVASLAEAWIEISNLYSINALVLVASLAEAWIEIGMLYLGKK